MSKIPKILITGLNSLIGWKIFSDLNLFFNVHGTYRKFNISFQNSNCSKVDFSHENCLDVFIKEFHPDVVIHTKGICDLDVCEDYPDLAEEINVKDTKRLIKVLKQNHFNGKFFLLSTDHVFDGKRGGYIESSQPNPIHQYGRTKLQAEEIVKNELLDWVVIRPGLCLGESVQGNVGPLNFFKTRILEGKVVSLFTDEWRSPVSLDLLSEQIRYLLENDMKGTFHISSADIISRFELAILIARKLRLNESLIYPKLRCEDQYAKIRPRILTLKSERLPLDGFNFDCIK